MLCLRKKLPALCAVLVLGLYVYLKRENLFSVAAVMIYACACTLLLSPICRRLEQKGVKASCAALLSVIVILLIIALLISVFIPYLVTHTIAFARRSTPTALILVNKASEMLAQLGLHVQQSFADLLGGIVPDITAFFARMGMTFAAQTGRFFFSLVICYYFLCERKIFANHLLLCIPLNWRTAFLRTIFGCRNAVMGYLSGLIKTCAFITAATYVGLLLIGVPDAFLLSMFMGLFEVLPYVGPVLAAIPILLSALPLGMETTLLSLLLVVLVQQIEGNFVSPYFTASSTSIHPLAALISVFVFGSLMGIWGILLAVPIVVTVRSIGWSLRQATIS